MKTDSQITKGIMRRVYAVYALRRLSHPAVRLGVLLALLLSLRELVWVSRVFENLSQKTEIGEFLNYGFSAFIGTEFVVQLVLIVGAGIVAYSAKDLFSMRHQQFA